MAYLKPPWFTVRVFNPLAMKLGRMQTLEVKGRRTGRPHRIPVVVPDIDGIRYLVSTRGESEWVRNVRTDAQVKVDGIRYTATEVPVDQRAPILAAYRPIAGKVVEGYWRQLPNDADHPVFALAPH